MINRYELSQYNTIRALAFSLFWHLFWLLLFMPVLNNSNPRVYLTSTSFLGNILKDSDFVLCKIREGGRKTSHSVSVNKFKDNYFSKEPSLSLKPKVPVAGYIKDNQFIFEKITHSKSEVTAAKKIVFGLDDYGDYLDKVDFAELKRVSSRDDIAAYVDFRIFLGRAGEVLKIKKTGASGDPVLDLYIIRKLKTAIFRQTLSHNTWMDLRFKIKK